MSSRTVAVCVVDLEGRGEVDVNADRVMQAASAFKIAVALEVFCQASSSELDVDEQLDFRAERAPLRDGAIAQAVELMMRLSDNAAATALINRVTRHRIVVRLHSLGLRRTTVGDGPVAEVAGITGRLNDLARTAGFADWAEPHDIVYAGAHDQVADRLARLAVDEHALPHERLGPTTTARELATLYRMIWRDEAGPADACAAVREAASHQQLERLALGFDPASKVTVAGKGGRIPGIVLNDAGVITFPDGRRYATAILTRAHHAFDDELTSYQLIGSLAATATDGLRGLGISRSGP